jgi:hypothetical protein
MTSTEPVRPVRRLLVFPVDTGRVGRVGFNPSGTVALRDMGMDGLDGSDGFPGPHICTCPHTSALMDFAFYVWVWETRPTRPRERIKIERLKESVMSETGTLHLPLKLNEAQAEALR